MSNRHPFRRALIALPLVLAACTGAGGPTATPVGSGGPTEVPSQGIEHPTGATDVILRMEVGGEFVPIEFNLVSVPVFTLYGDGRVVYVAQDPNPPEFQPGAPMISNPLRTAMLSPEQVAAVLEFALRDGGLAAARLNYTDLGDMMIADAPSTTFTLNANGVEKVVQVYALGFDAAGGPDVAIRAAMSSLADRLADFDQGGSIASSDFEPEAYRGMLVESGGLGGPQRPWPWDGFTSADFTPPADANALPVLTRTLTPADVAVLEFATPMGGLQGLTLTEDGKSWTLVLRPLLPDEEA